MTAVVVLGADAEAVAARVAALRASGRRAAGFVGDDTADDRAAAEAMAAELFGPDATILVLVRESGAIAPDSRTRMAGWQADPHA